MKIIFLDIDGVLNSRQFIKFCFQNSIDADDRIDPQTVKLLNKTIDNTGSKVVISSSWRIPFVNNNFQFLVNRLENLGIRSDTIIGFTPIRNDGRGKEIQQWLDENKSLDIKSIVILDDDNDMFELSSFLVKTSFDYGLQPCHVDQAISILNHII